MTDNKLTLKYNIDKWNGKPYNTDDLHLQGVI